MSIFNNDFIRRSDVLKGKEIHYSSNGVEIIEGEAVPVEYINNIPSVDVHEVKHGHWVWDKNGMDWGIGAWVCSACHTRAQTQWSMISRNPRHFSGHQYCSVCGAKMDEEEKENDDL